MIVVNAKTVIDAYKRNSYPLDPVLNIFGIRVVSEATDKWDDLIGFLYNDKDTPQDDWSCLAFEATTDPGLFYLKNPMSGKGTSIMKSGFYKDAYRLGLHKGKSPALVQVGKIDYYLDRNRDAVYDRKEANVVSGIFGTNIHATKDGLVPEVIGPWSAGCQVLRRTAALKQILTVAKEAEKKFFSYALFLGKDFPNSV